MGFTRSLLVIKEYKKARVEGGFFDCARTLENHEPRLLISLPLIHLQQMGSPRWRSAQHIRSRISDRCIAPGSRMPEC